MPTVVRKDLDNTSAILTVVVNRDELKPKLDAELKKFRQRAAIKGFRHGQAPMDFVKRMYGTAIFVDIFNDMISKELFDYIKESKLNILGQPLPTEDQEKYAFKISDPEPEYAIHYEVGFTPSFELVGLDKNETFERLTVANLDELAEEDLQYARRRMGKTSNSEEQIQDNDIIKIAARELESADGSPKEGGLETTMTFHLKSVVDEGFKTELLAKKQGDTVRFNARTVEKQAEDKMYRKYILSLEDDDDREVDDWFEGTIEDVSRVEDAELDETFYEGYFGSGVSNREEAIEQIKKGIAQFYETRSNALLMRNFRERLLERNRVELPDHFLQRWLSSSNEGALSAESIAREYPGFAENLRWTMVRDRVKEQFNIEVTEEDVVNEYANRVRNYFRMDLPDNILTSSIERLMKDEKEVEKTRENLETDKLFQVIRTLVTLTDKPVPSEKFHKILETVTRKAQIEQSEGALFSE